MNKLSYIFLSFRLRDWIGNLFIFIPLILAGLIFDSGFFLKAVEAFFLFSLSAGAISILNDVLDIKKDKNIQKNLKGLLLQVN